MNGILCINKPQEYTSFDVIARIRGMSKTKRVGHSGTLDPMATGVLPVFIGNATKACDMLPNDNKSYLAEFKLGIRTDTLDITGKVLNECKSEITAKAVEDCLKHFRGEILQIPPMYSAVRVNGQRLYDIARQGREIERQPRAVTVFELKLEHFDENTQKGRLHIKCSKGTYIRTIIGDLGDALNTGAAMTALCRTEACGFTLDDCITLEQAQQLTSDGSLEKHLLKTDRIFYHLPKIQLNEIQSVKFKNGVKLDLNRVKYKDINGNHRVYDDQKNFLGLASLNKEKMELIIEKMFYR